MNSRLNELWLIGDWEVAPERGEIRRGDECRKLDPRAMRLLVYLAERADQVVGLSELLDGVWGKSIVTPHSVYEAVAALRQGLDDSAENPEYIVTVPRRGYRLVATVRRPDPIENSSATSAAAVVETQSLENASRRRALILSTGIGLVGMVSATVVWRHLKTPLRDEKSIAVLPFVDLSANKDQQYFADGLAEELINVLANVSELRVVARTSSFQFRNRNEDIRTIGKKLDVGYVVEGSMRREAGRVRVVAQLIRTSDGTHQWSNSFDRDVDDLIRLESELALAVGRALELSVPSDVAERVASTRSAAANDHFLRGLHSLDRYTRAGAEEAANEFEAAISLDDKFAAAFVSLGMTRYVQGSFGFAPSERAFRQLRYSTTRALTLNSKSAVAHALLARAATLYDWNWDEARGEVDAALLLSPHNSFAQFAAGDLALVLGNYPLAERHIRAALINDPLNPELMLMLAVVLRAADRPDEAEAAVRECLAISPTFVYAHALLGNILTESRREGDIEACRAASVDGDQLTCLAKAYHARGRTAEALALMDEVVKRGSLDRGFWIASAFAALGDADKTFEWLERAYARREAVIPYIKSTREFDVFRDDPRYRNLLERLKLPRN